jgi:phosphoglycolate phosphatase
MVGIVLFDLDGTLADSEPGILSSLRQAFAEVGVAAMNTTQERALLGPPFWETLPPLVGADRVGDVIAAYRRFYSAAGMYDTVLYDGIVDVLDWLAARRCVLAIATSKSEHYAVAIVERLGVAARFAVICGDTLDGARGSKALVVQEALRRLGDPDPATVVMVGDRSQDVVGARSNGVPCIGASWGYGDFEELTAAGAVAVAAGPRELPEILTAMVGAAPALGGSAD